MVKCAEDTDMVVARCGKGQKIASGTVSVKGVFSTDTTCNEIIYIFKPYTHGIGTDGLWTDIRAYPSDTAGYLLLEVFQSDSTAGVASYHTATDVHWAVLGTK